MIWVDWIIIGIFVVSALISIKRGFVKEILSLIVWLIAFLVAIQFYIKLGDFLFIYINNQTASYLVAFVLLLVGSLLSGGIINFYINKLMQKTGLSVTDRLLGTIFGLLRGLAVIMIVIMVLDRTPIRNAPAWDHSIMVSYFKEISVKIWDFFE